MPKKRTLEGRCKEERAQARQNLGTLHELAVQPATRKRYDLALNRFLQFLRNEGLELPTLRSKVDDLVSEYLEFLWSSGEGRALACDTLASLQNFDPHLKGHLLCSWRLRKIWSQKELPNRAPPVPEPV